MLNKKFILLVFIFLIINFIFFNFGIHWHGFISDKINYFEKLKCFAHNNFSETFQLDCYYPIKNNNFVFSNKLKCQILTNNQIDDYYKNNKKSFLLSLIKADYQSFYLNIDEKNNLILKSYAPGEPIKSAFTILKNNKNIISGYRFNNYDHQINDSQFITISKKSGKGIIYWFNEYDDINHSVASEYFFCQNLKDKNNEIIYFDKNNKYYLFIPKNFIYRENNEEGLFLEKYLKYLHRTENYIQINTLIDNWEDFNKLKIGEKKLIKNNIFNQYNYFTRLSDEKIDNLDFKVFYNDKVFETSEKTKYYIYCNESINFCIQALINDDKDERHISFNEFQNIIKNLKFTFNDNVFYQTFVDKDIGIQFKYPINFYISTVKSNKNENYYKKIFINNKPIENISIDSSNNSVFSIEYFSKEKVKELALNKDLPEAYEYLRNNVINSFQKQSFNHKKILINGIEADEYSGNYTDYFSSTNEFHKIIFIINDKGLFKININFQIISNFYTETIFNKILDSFKFLD